MLSSVENQEKQDALYDGSFDLTNNGNMKGVKALLALLHGKRDSITKMFYEPITTGIDAISMLNTQICEKLSNNHVSEISISVDVSVIKGKTISLSSWADFEQYRWDMESNKINNILIKWDFFIFFPGYGNPQRHTISVKLSNQPSPMEILNALLSDLSNDLSDDAYDFALIVCRVDFINHILADEITNIVKEWLDLCDKSDSNKGLYKFLRRYSNVIARIFDFSIISTVALLGMVTISLFGNQGVSFDSSYVLIVTLSLGYIFAKAGKFAGNRISSAISSTSRYHMFNISNGDKKEVKYINEKRTKKAAWFWFILNVVINILLAVVLFKIQ